MTRRVLLLILLALLTAAPAAGDNITQASARSTRRSRVCRTRSRPHARRSSGSRPRSPTSRRGSGRSSRRSGSVSSDLERLEQDLALQRERLTKITELWRLQTAKLGFLRRQHEEAIDRLSDRLVAIYQSGNLTHGRRPARLVELQRARDAARLRGRARGTGRADRRVGRPREGPDHGAAGEHDRDAQEDLHGCPGRRRAHGADAAGPQRARRPRERALRDTRRAPRGAGVRPAAEGGVPPRGSGACRRQRLALVADPDLAVLVGSRALRRAG